MEPGNRDIAIIGMSCRFPGHCNDLESFWDLLKFGRDGVTSTDCRWGEAVALPTCKSGGFLDDVDCFDSSFFSILPKEAVKMDPQHRVLLELHWEALESACIPLEAIKGSDVGVFVGAAWNQYENLCFQTKVAPEKMIDHHDLYLTTGSLHCMAGGAVSFFFDLKGPCMSVDAACSSSLVTMHLACQALLNDECRMAFASGVSLNLSPEISTNFTQSKLLSDRCRAFNAGANGYCRSEGGAVVLLKKYEDAVRDGNRILAVVKASALNQNGRGSAGITAPNGEAQRDVYWRALNKSGLQPHDIGYIEAHGTGTEVGDPAELEGLAAVYGSGRGKQGPIGIGSVKTNIGHTEMAAGLAGVIKMVLAFQHEYIPPHIHFTKLSPGSPNLVQHGLEIIAKGKKWPNNGEAGPPRLASVSSFGFSGSNSHAIIGEAPHKSEKYTLPSYAVLTLSAKTKTSLDALLGRYQTYFRENAVELTRNGFWSRVAFTSNVGRTHFPNHRAAFVLDAGCNWGQVLTMQTPFQGSSSKSKPAKMAHFLLMGACTPELLSLGSSLYKSPAQHTIFCDMVNECGQMTGIPVSDFVNDPKSTPGAVSHQMLLGFVVEYAIAATLVRYGVTPSLCTCYGIGEYVGACLAGIITLKDALKLVVALEEATVAGHVKAFDMLLVHGQDENSVVKMLSEFNPDATDVRVCEGRNEASTLLCGESSQVKSIAAHVGPAKCMTWPGFCMPTANAKGFLQIAEHVKYSSGAPTGSSPVQLVFAFGGGDGQHVNAEFWLAESRQVKATAKAKGAAMNHVRFHTSHGPNSAPNMFNVLIGPHPQIRTWNQENAGGKSATDDWLILADESRVYEAVARLYAAGHAIQWTNLHAGRQRMECVELPKYAFDKKRYWYPDTPLVRVNSVNVNVNKSLEQQFREKDNDSQYAHVCNVSIPENVLNEVDESTPREWTADVQQYEDLFQELCIHQMLRAFVIMKIPKLVTGKGWTVADLGAAAGINEKNMAQFERLLWILTASGYFVEKDGLVHIGSVLWRPSDELSARAVKYKKQLKTMIPEREVLLEISFKCGENLHLILQDKINALKYLFPPASDNAYSVGRFYAESPDLHACNQVLEKLVGSLAHLNHSTPIKILEVGAGTGSSTRYLLNALESRGLPFELTFTDISKVFFHQAKEKLRTGPNVEYMLLDIEGDPLTQGYTARSFDIVIASNVIHATKVIRKTLRNVMSVLRPGGYLLMCEYIRPVPAMDITFGTLSGWWAFKGHDPERTHAMMSAEKWIHTLETSGFDQCRCIGFPVALIVGRLQAGLRGDSAGIEFGGEHQIVVTPPPIEVEQELPQAQKVCARPAAMHTLIKDKVLQALMKVTGLEAEEIDEGREFSELGMDSLMKISFEHALTEDLGVLDPVAAIQTHSCVRDLVAFILETSA